MQFDLNIISKKIISFLVILMPFSLITGPFLPDLSVVIILLAFSYLIINEKLYYFFQSKYSKIFFIFFFILLISSFFSTNILVSLKKTFFYLRFFILSLAIIYILNTDKKILIKIFYVLFACFAILILDGYYQFFYEENILKWKIVGTRVSSFFKDELILGSYLARMFPIFLSIFIFFNKNFKIYFKIFVFIIFILSEVLVFLSGERVALFYINFSAFFLLITFHSYKRQRFLILVISILLMFLIGIFSPKYKERIFDRSIEQIGLNAESNEIHIFSLEHTNHYKSAYLMFLDNKFFGIGPRMFRENCNLEKYKISFESCSTHPHNTYIQALAEIGLFGFLFLVCLFFSFLFYFFKHLKIKIKQNKNYFSDFQLALLSSLLIIIWPFVPTGGLFNNWLNIIYFYSLGLFLWSLGFSGSTKSKT